jgi:hypothetical protein
MLDGLHDPPLGNVGHLEPQHVVNVLKEQPFVARDRRWPRHVLEGDFADDLVPRSDIDHGHGVRISHRRKVHPLSVR